MTIDDHGDNDDDGAVRFEQWIRRLFARADPQWLLALVAAGPALDDPVAGAGPPRPGSLLARAYTAQAAEYRRHIKTGRKLRVLTLPDGRLMPLEWASRRRDHR